MCAHQNFSLTQRDAVYLQVCPVCAMRVGVDMVAHITLHHGNIFKISFSDFLCITEILSYFGAK